jgi:hypothetical protein
MGHAHGYAWFAGFFQVSGPDLALLDLPNSSFKIKTTLQTMQNPAAIP